MGHQSVVASCRDVEDVEAGASLQEINKTVMHQNNRLMKYEEETSGLQ